MAKKVLFQKKAALASSPNILELLSHSFFVGGYFVGPQFTMKKYQQVGHKSSKQLIELMHLLSQVTTPEYQARLPASGPLSFGLRRLLLAVGYMLFHVIGNIRFYVSQRNQVRHSSDLFTQGPCFCLRCGLQLHLIRRARFPQSTRIGQ